MKINKKLIKELVDNLEEFKLTELEYSDKDTKIKVSRQSKISRNISPEITIPRERAKGTITPVRPIIWTGGCINIPKCKRSGLIPCPSSGVYSDKLKGFANKDVVPSKKIINSKTNTVE